MEKKNSETWFPQYDLLRIIACFSVIMLHCSAQFWYVLPITGNEWLITNSYDSVSRFGVPLFVMISGALFLSGQKKFSVRRLFTHNILRMLSVYIFWSCAYGLLSCRNYPRETLDFKFVLRQMLHGKYHLWFLPMIIGLYLLVPILRVWVQNASQKNLQYFLALFLVCQIGKDTFIAFFPRPDFLYLASLANFDMICGYTGYFLLGYYLTRYEIPGKCRRLLYLAAFPALLANVFFSAWFSRKQGTPNGEIFDAFCLFTFLFTVALFLFVAEKTKGKVFSARAEKLIRELSRNTLGIYILHLGVIELLNSYGINSKSLPIAVGVPLLAVFCFLFCCLLAALLRRIPLIGKYIC
ncbi:MAG: acyltransferase family protein [Roseburia sp.]|nr:acyltransferase family protein [Roseburia sp.]MCM1098942.1 acyltransferase family protein [Ruminococcus flavefaciens]